MALDTPRNRFGMLGDGLPFPTGVIDAPTRQEFLGDYPGIPYLVDETVIDAAVEAEAAAAATLSTTRPLAAAAEAAVAAEAALAGTHTLEAEAEAIAAAAASVMPVVTGERFDRRVRVEVYDPSGAKLAYGPVVTATAVTYSHRLDEVGTFTVEVPASDERVSYIGKRYELRVFREAEGEVFRGIVDTRETVVDESGAAIVRLSGSSTGRRLVWLTTLLGRQFDGASLSSAVTTLLSGTGFSAGAVASKTVTARFDGATRFAALANLAEQTDVHVREDPVAATVDVAAFGDDSGITLANVGVVTPELQEAGHLFPVTRIAVLDDGADIINRVIPVGSGQGPSQLTMRYSNRASPYTIQSATGPDGRTYWYLEDGASVAAFGATEKVISFPDVTPLANTSAALQKAANALYDYAAAFLRRNRDGRQTYEVEAVGLRHYQDGVARLKVGQKLRLRYKGVATAADGASRVYLAVDTDLWLIGFSRAFTDDGTDRWTLEVSTVDVADDGVNGPIADAIEDLYSVKVTPANLPLYRTYTVHRQSIESGGPYTYSLKFDANIALIHLARLSFFIRPLRSNTTTAASGGGTTPTSSSGGGSTVTSDAGGGTTVTSATEGSHTHGIGVFFYILVPTVDDVTPSGHNHTSATTDAVNPTTPHSHPVSGASGTSSHNQTLTKADAVRSITTPSTTSAGSNHQHNVTIADHSHGVTIAAHTHTVTIPAHTHGLVYGIFTASNPSAAAVELWINGTNRTSALGGPWSAPNTEISLDITQYLQGTGEQVLQQVNTIQFRAGQLCDIEGDVLCLVTRASLVPV